MADLSDMVLVKKGIWIPKSNIAAIFTLSDEGVIKGGIIDLKVKSVGLGKQITLDGKEFKDFLHRSCMED